MPFARPSLPDLIDRIAADIETQLPGVDARLRRSNLNVLARAEAGVAHSLYGYLDWLARQLMPDTAEVDYLERWSIIWGVTRLAATYATGAIAVTGVNGTVIPNGTFWTRSDAQRYASTADATISGGAATIPVIAETAGAAANTDANTTLTVSSPIAGLNASATVEADGLADGLDQEDDDALRARLVARIQQPPMGGAAYDYEAWAKQVAGVTRVWVYPLYLGLGTVGVFFVCDDLDPIIPDADKVAEVQTCLDLVRPVTADVTVMAPIAYPVDFEVVLSPNTAATRSAVTASLTDYLFRDGVPGATLYLSRIMEAISIAAGESYHVLTVPDANVVLPAGRLGTLGTITFS